MKVRVKGEKGKLLVQRKGRIGVCVTEEEEEEEEEEVE